MQIFRNMTAVIQNIDVYDEINMLKTITKQDVDEFIKEYFDFNKMATSKVLGI